MRHATRHHLARTGPVLALTLTLMWQFVIKPALDKDQGRSMPSAWLSPPTTKSCRRSSRSWSPYHGLIMNELEARATDVAPATTHVKSPVCSFTDSPPRGAGQHLRKLLLTAPGPDRVELIRSRPGRAAGICECR